MTNAVRLLPSGRAGSVVRAVSPFAPPTMNVSGCAFADVCAQTNVLSSPTVVSKSLLPALIATFEPANDFSPATHPRTPRSSGMTTSEAGFAAFSVFANSGTISRGLSAFVSGFGSGSGRLEELTSAVTSETERRPAVAAASQRGRDIARIDSPLSGTLTGTGITTD